MAIQVADGFSLQSQKPIDARLQFDTVANMKAYAENSLYNGCFAYVTETKKYYSYDSSNSTDSTLGKWREYSSGGGAQIDDSYTGTDKTWSSSKINDTKQNQTLSSSVILEGLTVTSLESAISALTRIATIVTISTDALGGNSSSNFNKTDYSKIGNIKAYMYKWGAGSSKPYTSGVPTWFSYPGYEVNYLLVTYRNAEDTQIDEHAWCYYTESSVAKVRHFSRRATKSGSTWTFPDWVEVGQLPVATSTVLGGVKVGENMTITDGVLNPSYLVVANKFNKSDLYSTTEKVVGCWTDGRPIYQKTLVDTMPSCATDGTYVDKYISIGASILNFISINCIARDSVGSEFELSFLSKTQQLLSNNQIISARAQCLDNNASSNANTLRISSSGTAFNTYSLYATLQYTKTTDAANSFKYADENDYSTSEKIIGKWIDGSTIYQKTLQITMPTTEKSGVVVRSFTSVGASVSRFIEIKYSIVLASYTCVTGTEYVSNTVANISTTSTPSYAVPVMGVYGVSKNASSNPNTIRVDNSMPTWSGATLYVTAQYIK